MLGVAPQPRVEGRLELSVVKERDEGVGDEEEGAAPPGVCLKMSVVVIGGAVRQRAVGAQRVGVQVLRVAEIPQPFAVEVAPVEQQGRCLERALRVAEPGAPLALRAVRRNVHPVREDRGARGVRDGVEQAARAAEGAADRHVAVHKARGQRPLARHAAGQARNLHVARAVVGEERLVHLLGGAAGADVGAHHGRANRNLVVHRAVLVEQLGVLHRYDRAGGAVRDAQRHLHRHGLDEVDDKDARQRLRDDARVLAVSTHPAPVRAQGRAQRGGRYCGSRRGRPLHTGRRGVAAPRPARQGGGNARVERLADVNIIECHRSRGRGET